MMKRRTRPLAASAVVLSLATAAIAGTVKEFETSLRDAWSDYRLALFATNAGKSAEAGRALASLLDKWTKIETSYAAAPPPQSRLAHPQAGNARRPRFPPPPPRPYG